MHHSPSARWSLAAGLILALAAPALAGGGARAPRVKPKAEPPRKIYLAVYGLT